MNETSQEEFMFVSFEWTDKVDLPIVNIPIIIKYKQLDVWIKWSDLVIEVRLTKVTMQPDKETIRNIISLNVRYLECGK